MATLDALISRVAKIVQDDDFDPYEITAFLNRGVAEIAGGMQSTLGEYTTPPLPNLFSIGTVTTVSTAAYASMPATFQRALVFAVNAAGIEIDIAHTWQEFVDAEPLLDRSGRLYEVIEQGGNLYYQGIPAADEVLGSDDKNYTCILKHTASDDNKPVTGADYTTYWTQSGSSGSAWVDGTSYSSGEDITVHFYRLPVDMSDGDDPPDGIPLHLQDPLLVNYACYKIFELIEDGIEGVGVNTQRYEKRFLQALKTLEMSIPRYTRSLFLGD